jgi:acetyl-CoA synthetase
MSFSNIFQMSPEDIFWCTADIGWVTGHTYLTYGPLLNAQTTVMFEGIDTYPDGGRFWDIVDRHQVTHLYTAPTAIRALEALPIELVEKRKLTSLKVLGSVGEPINEEAWEWYHKNIGKGRCPIVDTWWQTETGGIMISSLPNITEQIPSYAATPQPGVIPVLVDANGAEVSGNPAEGHLCLKNPWPGIARTVYGDHKRYMETYFSAYPGMYFTGDGAKRDQRGNYRITGRVDDVINISGHRIGTAEVEEAINEHPGIVESAVVGFPHEIKGQGLYAYVIANSQKNLDEGALKKEVNDVITEMIGPIAKVDHLQIVSGLPKTRSGKIMRRLLRDVAENRSLGDVTTLADPTVMNLIGQGLSTSSDSD